MQESPVFLSGRSRTVVLLRHAVFLFTFFSYAFVPAAFAVGPAAAPVAPGTVPITVKGQVTDANGQPLINVTVQVKGTVRTAVSDANGNYSITAEDNSTLIFSFIGYNNREEAVKGRATINVSMELNGRQMNEVVVTALGIRKERRALGYSVTEVSGASLTQARENNVVNGLEGKVAGVNVSGVATGPGGSANVVIRGISSITGSSQPLYVVDGIPLTNTTHIFTDRDGYGGTDGGDGIGSINPDDIETISILKGAAASALYGYRGSKGVILITTKSGKRGKGIGVDFNSNYVLERVIDNTDFQTTYGQGYAGLKPTSGADALSSGLSSWGAKLDGSSTPQFDGVSRPYSAVKGNIHHFYRDGGNATNTIAFSKGFGDEGGIRFSTSILHDKSLLPNAGLNRQSFNLSTNYQLDKHLKMELKANYITQQTKNTPSISDAPGNMNFAVMFLPPNVDIRSLSPGYTNTGAELRFSGDEFTTNPYFAAYKFENNVNRNRFIGMSSLRYTFDNGLYIMGRAGEDYFIDHGVNVTPDSTAYLPPGSLIDNTYRSTELNIDGLIGKNFKVGSGFAINASAGANYRKYTIESTTIAGNAFAIPFLYTIGNLQNSQPSYINPRTVDKSLYATLDLSYKNFLYLNATGRNDWYSTLAPGKINYFYPSLNASFVFSELMSVPDMDFGKIRIGYADVGGEAEDPYGTFLNYNIVATLNGFPVGNIVNGNVPNSNLVPSSVKEVEIGAELSFFKNRLKFDVAAYQKKIERSIIAASISETSGYTGAFLNIGKLRNNGIEWLVTGTPVKSARFTWNITLNGSYNSNKVLALSSSQDNILLANSRVGEDNGQNAYIAQLVGKTASQIVALDPERDANGKVIIDPTTGAPDPNNAVYKPFGSGIDPWGGGINNEFYLGNFNLSFLVDGKFGGKIFSGTNGLAYQMGLSKETLAGRDLTYGDGSNGTTPLIATDYYNILSTFGSKFIYDASFIKLRQVILGYTWPAKSFNNKIQGLTLSFVARNPFVLMKHTPNIDPESNYTNSNAQGLELAAVPATKTFGLNLNVKF
jgi:TonB-linked SusC/RagA family outer membrane protein